MKTRKSCFFNGSRICLFKICLVGCIMGQGLPLFSAPSAHGETAESKQTEVENKEASIERRTDHDFENTLLEGRMRAPSGHVLHGRKTQSKTQMVSLRRSFKMELKNSRKGVQALP